MAKTKKTGICLELDQMTTTEKIRAMECLWDDLCRRTDEITSPLWHNDVLIERERDVLAGEANFCEWEAAKAKIRKSMPLPLM
jgi:hypothetical protein